jgi:hypothetical protein
MKHPIWILIIALVFAVGCGKKAKEEPKEMMFKGDVAFLHIHTRVVVLSDLSGQAQVAVNPDLQGRVMTSTAGGADGLSYGWINRELLASKQNNIHINAFGGEDRFWLGPEGGQFSIFFKKGARFNLDNWFTPPPINEGAYEILAQSMDRIHFKKAMHLVNYSGTEFDLELDRKVRLLAPDQVQNFGISVPPGVKMVAYQSDNTITNSGLKEWTKATGLLSIWILGIFNPSPSTTVVIPFKAGPAAELGPVVNDAYFGKVPADRLSIKEVALFFSGDGKYRSKIGISPKRVKPYLGSYDAANRVLTIVHFTIPEGATDYVNSMWQIQENPFGGDVANSYNDGPASHGAKPLGPFYELESSSPAAALKPGQSLQHVHTTMHFQGEEKALDAIAQQVLGVGIEEIKTALKTK